jgi:hypothetical protein
MGNIVGGFIAVALGILALVYWQWRVIEVIQGMLPIALIGIGLVAIVAGWEIVKEIPSDSSETEEPE